MTDDRPVWLLDVDGVINVVAAGDHSSSWPRQAWRRIASINGWPILVATPVLDFLRLVHELDAAEIQWNTTWQHDAPRCLAPALDLPDWPVAEERDFAAEHDSYLLSEWSWWKLHAAQQVVLTEERRLVWTDDDIDHERRSNDALSELLMSERVCAISPSPYRGLTPQHLTRIAQFLGIGEDPRITKVTDSAVAQW